MQSLFLFVPVVKAHPRLWWGLESLCSLPCYKQLAIRCGFIYKKMKLFPFRRIEFLSQQVDKWPQTPVVEKKRQLPWCAAELPDEHPLPLKDSSKMSPCTHTEIWGENLLQDRNLHLCLHSSSTAFADRQGWWFAVAAVAGRLPCLDKACGKAVPSPWSPVPVWPVSIAQMLQILSETMITNLFLPPQQQLKKQV